MRGAAEALRAAGAIPFAVYCSDPCDGRTQGTTGMFDSLAYRNDAAIVMRRLIRSLPTASGVIGIATCDKGLPGDDAGARRHEGAARGHRARRRHAAGARRRGRRAGAEPRRAILARSDQPRLRGHHGVPRVRVVGRRLPVPRHRRHVAGGGGGVSGWRCRTARSRRRASRCGWSWRAARPRRCSGSTRSASRSGSCSPPPPSRTRCSCTRRSAARRISCCTSRRSRPPPGSRRPPSTTGSGSTARRRGWWTRCRTARAASPTAQVFMAGGVPEVMLHLRRMGLLNGRVLTATGDTLDTTLDWWEASERRRAARARLASAAAIDPDHVIMAPDAARARRAHEHRRLPARQPRPAGLGGQGDGHRCVGDRRRRRLPASWSRAGVHRRARGHPRGEGRVQPGRCARAT